MTHGVVTNLAHF